MNPLSAYLPQDRRRALAHQVPLPERADGSVLFADVSGFTPLSELLARALGARRGAEEMTQRLNQVYDALIAQIDAFGGSVVSFAGDAMTCWFAHTDGDSVRRAVAAAFAMQDVMRQFANVTLPDGTVTTLGVKIAIAHGITRRFIAGDPSIQLYDILAGDAVMRTAQGEGLATRGEILLDENGVRVLGADANISEWRTAANGDRFAVLARPTAGALPVTAGEVPDLEDGLVQAWVLPAVYAQHHTGLTDFLTELRPVVAVFVRFGGIDLERDEAAGEKFNRFLGRVQEIVGRFGGTLLEITVGDKGSYLYLVFGAPQAHDDDPRRALYAAQALLELPRALEFLEPLQIGVSQGSMRVGAYGGITRRNYGVQGDEVNLAARLMSKAAPGELLVSQRIQKAVADEFDLEPLAPLRLKGKAEPLLSYLVKGTHSESRYQQGQAPQPMLGRVAELAGLTAALEAARGGHGQIVGITAEAGMGKSRLMAELVWRARRNNVRVLGSECASFATNSSFFVWTRIWRDFFEIDPHVPLRRQQRALERVVQDYAPARLDALPLMEAVLHLDLAENAFTRALEPQDRKAILEATLLECLRTAAREEQEQGGALLVLVDDAHWLDPASRDFLERVADAIVDAPVMLVLGYRPMEGTQDGLPRWHRAAHFSELALTELDEAAAEALIRAKLLQLAPESLATISPTLIARLATQAQGNPFYLEELINYLNDRGVNLRDAAALAAIDLPNSLHRLVLSRIDQLPPHQQLTLKVASIIGRWFRVYQLLGYYPALGVGEVVRSDLVELERVDLTPLDEPEPNLTYFFKHIVTQQVTYNSLAYSTRAALHEQYAGYLEKQDATLPLDLLAYHYGQSENQTKTREYARRAGQAAAARFANVEAVAYLSHALELTPTNATAERFDLLCAREQVYDVQGARDLQRADLEAMAVLAQEFADPHMRALAALRRGWYAERTGVYADAITQARQAVALLETAKGDALTADALILWGQALSHQAEYAEANAQTARALAYAEAIGDAHYQALAKSRLGIIAHRQGQHAAAQQFHQQALELARSRNDRRLECLAHNHLGMVARELGDYTRALVVYTHALQAARAIGDRTTESIVLANLAETHQVRGEYDRAQQYAREALTVARAAQNRQHERSALTTLGQSYWATGDYVRAREATLRAVTIAEETGDRFGQELALGNLAEIALDTNEVGTARTLAVRALEIANAIADREGQAFLQTTLGYVALEMGENETALGHFEQACALWGDAASGPDALKAWAGLAEVYQGLGDTGGARESVETLFKRMENTAADAVPTSVFLTMHKILVWAGDPRAAALLTTARNLLFRRAQDITDVGVRRSFLENVRAHAELSGIVF